MDDNTTALRDSRFAIGTTPERRQEFLRRLHVPIQTLLVTAIGPSAVVIFLFLAIINRVWQSTTVLFLAFSLEMFWLFSFGLLKRGGVGLSVLLAALAAIVFVTITACLIPDVMPGAVLSCVATLLYCALYSKRATIVIAVAFGVAFFVAELSFLTDPIEVLEISASSRFYTALAMGITLVPLVSHFLVRSHWINEFLFQTREAEITKQVFTLRALVRIRDVIDDAVVKVREVSARFAQQSKEQAMAAMKINVTVGQVSSNSRITAIKANDAQNVAKRIQARALKSSDSLRHIERGFKDVVGIIGNARNQVIELERDVIEIEAILRLNEEIGRQTQILAVNAGMQAAKAGQDLGGGFRVIATELQQMIHDTEVNLKRSRNLLVEIREQAHDSSEKIKTGSEGLTRFFNELRAASDGIESSAENLVVTVKKISTIAYSAREQQNSMADMSLAMKQVDTAAGELSRSAMQLVESVEQIVAARNTLNDVLSKTELEESQAAGTMENRYAFVSQLYMPVQRLIVGVLGPAIVVSFGILSYMDPCPQNIKTLAVAVGLCAAWLFSILQYQKKRFGTGILIVVLSSFVMTTAAGVFHEGLIPVVMLGNVGIMSYGIFYSRRFAPLCMVSGGLSYLICELNRYLGFIETRPLGEVEQFVIAIFLFFVLIPIITRFFRRSQTINSHLLLVQRDKSRQQAAIIDTINNVSPIVEDATAQIRQVSELFNLQAGEQEELASQMHSTVSYVSENAIATASSAAIAKEITESTQIGSAENNRRLIAIRNEFRDVAALIEAARQNANAFAMRIDEIEEILGFNVEIVQQIKILAVNAAIQAAKAGEFQRGFKDVALKLRQMILENDRNLEGSRKLLEEIRWKAKESAKMIHLGQSKLDRYRRELKLTSDIFERSTARFTNTAQNVSQIAKAAQEQQESMRIVSDVMKKIEETAAKIASSSNILMDSVMEISGTQQTLQEVLSRTA